MNACQRCDYRATDRAELLEHATDAAHPLCAVGPHSLSQHETRTCERCLTRTRQHLSGILTMWVQLPEHMGPRGTGYDRGTPAAADGRPLLGGDALVLHSPGGAGYAHDPQVHRDTDPPSVAQVLATWEDDWRHTRGEPAAVVAGGRGGTSATIRHAAGYLERHSRWAATSHDAFADYAQDLAELHTRLEVVTGVARRRVIAEADCFECGGDLERLLTDKGYEDRWTCARCGRRYEWQAYLLALRARLEEAS